MIVYWEDAFAVNFLLDGLLLYLALKCVRVKVRPILLLISSLLGGAEAVVFPLFSLPSLCGYAVKFLGGLLLPLLAVGKGGLRQHVFAECAFFGLTFLFGGLLVAIYSFSGVSYSQNGYFVESAPVTLVLASSLIFFLLVRRAALAFYRYRKIRSGIFSCKLWAGGKQVSWRGLADSGNCLSFRGRPVCVLSAIGALALFSGKEPLGRMNVSTVNGSRESPVFVCERLEIDCGKKKIVREGVCLTVGEIGSKDYQLIIHTACLEG